MKSELEPVLESEDLANALPQIVWTADAIGRTRWINNRWIELTGLTFEESLDKRALAAVHPDDHEQMQRAWGVGVETKSPVEIEYRIRSRDGAYRWHLARAVPMLDRDGAIVRWVGTAFDVQSRREAEDARREFELRFETAFELTPQPMAIVRIDNGHFLQINEAFRKIVGLSESEIIHKNLLDIGLMQPEQRDALRASMLAADRTATATTIRTREGRRIDLVITTRQIDFAGTRCLIGVANDVTAHRATEAALRESEAKERARADELEALMDTVPAAVWIAHDPDCQEVSTNRAGGEILRIPPGANMSRSSNPGITSHFRVTVDGAEVSPAELPIQRAARGTEVRRFEEEIRFTDGHVTHLFGSAVPLRDPDGKPRGAIGAFVDVTQMKVAEAGMRDADRRKDEFLAMLSHELRNPLSPIITAAQLMELRGDEATASERGVILRQARHLLRLVDDLLDVSRIASGKVTLNKQYMRLDTAISNAIEATRLLFEEQHHTLSLSLASQGLAVEGDEIRLTQVISNLLTNAARYTPAGGRIEVSAAREADKVILRVRDSGPGIEASLREKIFEMFVQGERGPDRALGGLGLGLFLVRLLTEAHGGSVHVTSEGPGRGSEFTVRLPAASERSRVGSDPPPFRERPKVSARIERILVVDDNQDGARTIAKLLERSGHQVRVAFDPSEAVTVAASFNPHVAIVDIGLPVMDGYSLGRELRARLDSPPILIALTGYGQDQDLRRSEEAGFAAHIVKPVYLEVLIGVLAKV